jgi:hypothetical protein
MIKSCSHIAACALAVLAINSRPSLAQHVEGGIDIGDIMYGPPPTQEDTPVMPVMPVASESASGVGFGINTGMLISPGYQDLLNDMYDSVDTTGGAPWVGFGIGINIHPNRYISIAADVELLMAFVSETSSSGDTSNFYANVMLVPSVSVRHTVTRPTSFFYGLEINRCVPTTSDSDFVWENAGTGVGFVAGLAFPDQMYLELNLSSMPIEVSLADFPMAHEEYNLGGVQIKFRKSF